MRTNIGEAPSERLWEIMMGQRSGAASDVLGHPDRVRSVLDDDAGPARSALAASWKRSITLYGLDPEDGRPPEVLTAHELAQARQEIEPLTRAAQTTLDRLFQAVGDTGCCVLLTNRDGVPVDRRGAAADDDQFRRWGLWSGAVWSEATEGANGIGTCLAESRPLTIHRDQHFHTRNIGLSCTAAPIYDHQGRLAAALDVSSARADLTEGFASLIAAAVGDAARSIEAQHFREIFSGTRIVLPPGGERYGSALLAVDRHDLVVGATRSARQLLNITDARIAGQLPAADVLAIGGAGEDLLDAERGAVRRALARADGNVSAAARALGVSRATLHRKLNRLGLASH
jgi:transcriptional regulator of acetoin/glycerol metabolism